MNTPETDQTPSEVITSEEADPDPSSQEVTKPGTALGVTPLAETDPDEPLRDGLFGRILARLGLRSSSTLRDDLKDALSAQGQGADNIFSPEERAMLNNILRLREVRVEDVMVPRADIIAVDMDISLDELLVLFEDSGHSRLPVFCETMDDPRGMVLIKDLQAYIVRTASRRQRSVASNARKTTTRLDFAKINLTKNLESLKLVRKVLFVPPSMLVTDLMARMQTNRTQMALVIDEYGGTDGLVSLEDIIEEVFGEIEDEHDDDESPNIEKTGEGVFIADSRTALEDAVKLIGPDFQCGDLSEDVDTIGGLVFSLAGRIPVRGEVIDGMPGFEFRILDADPRRIRRLQIVKRRSVTRSSKARRQAANHNEQSEKA